MFISIDVSYYLVFVYLWSSVRDDRRKHRTEGRIFDADWQEIHSRQRKSESGPSRNLKVAPRNIVWRTEEIQVWREMWLALIFVCRVFKYRYSKYSDQGEGRKGCMCVKGLLFLLSSSPLSIIKHSEEYMKGPSDHITSLRDFCKFCLCRILPYFNMLTCQRRGISTFLNILMV